MISGAIFDVDGTLLDSMSVWDTIGSDYLRSIGCAPREGLDQALRAMSLRQAAEHFRREYGVARSVEEIEDGVNAMLGRFYRERATLKPGAGGFVRALRGRGARLCIATATDQALVEAALSRCGILDCFEHVLTCASVGHGKDEPHIYREALKRIGGERRSTVVFEDALHAARTAKADGFAVAAVYDGHERQQEELRALADVYLIDLCHTDPFWKFASGL